MTTVKVLALSKLQSFSEVLPGTLVLPEGQLLHDPAPDTALYVPATHAVHVPPFGPVKPALHVQSEEASLPAGEDDPAGHRSKTMLHPLPPKMCPVDKKRYPGMPLLFSGTWDTLIIPLLLPL